MPTPAPIPDCSHCKWFSSEAADVYFCNHHRIKLAYPLWAFCSQHTERSELQNKPILEEIVKRSELRDDTMYLWLERKFRPDKMYAQFFFHVPLATIAEYTGWTEAQFMKTLAEIEQKYREE